MYSKNAEGTLAFQEQDQHRIAGGQINETPGNLFDYENDYALAHWISADSRFDVGISKFFQARYSTRDEFRQRFAHWGGSGLCLATNNNKVFNLVIKQYQYEQPLLRNVELALAHMKLIAEERNVYKIALPRIYTRRKTEGFTWQDVKDIIVTLFGSTQFDIRIVYLEECLNGNILDPDLEYINFGKDRKHIDGNLEHKYY